MFGNWLGDNSNGRLLASMGGGWAAVKHFPVRGMDGPTAGVYGLSCWKGHI